MRFYDSSEFKSFMEISFYDYELHLLEKIKKEVEDTGKEYIISVDEAEFINYLVARYTLDELSISESHEIKEPTKSSQQMSNGWDGSHFATVYSFNIDYPFTGSAQLFKIRPSSWVNHAFPISIDERNSIVTLQIHLTRMDPTEFQQEKNNSYRRAFANVNNVNNDAARWNGKVAQEIQRIFKAIKGKYLKENSFYAAINVKVNPNTQTVFSAPTITKKSIPSPPKR
jgi:hypothetical protein